MIKRKSRTINLGGVPIGGDSKISIQSMTNTDTRNRTETMAQINRLINRGCDIVRVAVPDQVAADQLPYYTEHSRIPVVADIHFDHKLALGAIDAA